MCLNCGCERYDDHMADERNITLEELAKAAIANDMHAGQTIENMKDALNHITPDMLQEAIDQVKAKDPQKPPEPVQQP